MLVYKTTTTFLVLCALYVFSSEFVTALGVQIIHLPMMALHQVFRGIGFDHAAYIMHELILGLNTWVTRHPIYANLLTTGILALCVVYLLRPEESDAEEPKE